MLHSSSSFFFFFNDTATTEIYTLSLHDALPISADTRLPTPDSRHPTPHSRSHRPRQNAGRHRRSEEHTSELQSRLHLVCRLLLEKKKNRAGEDTVGPARARFGSSADTRSTWPPC